MELPAPFFPHGEHLAIDLPGARAVFTTRRGGHSTGPFTSLNLGLKTGDDADAVARNRERVATDLGVMLAHVRQVHGTTIHTRQRPANGAVLEANGAVPEADGLLTTDPGLGAMVTVADCLPVVVATPGAVAVLHAGWRGLSAGILSDGVAALRRAAGADGPIAAAIGPGAGGCCYEVGDEVRAAFERHGDAVRDGRRIDLKAIARHELEAAGVEEVYDVRLCTLHADSGLLFSHRRDGGITGRQAGIAWLT